MIEGFKEHKNRDRKTKGVAQVGRRATKQYTQDILDWRWNSNYKQEGEREEVRRREKRRRKRERETPVVNVLYH